MRVLERRDAQSPRGQARDELGDQGSFAGAAPAGEADDAHGALYRAVRDPPANRWCPQTRTPGRGAGRRRYNRAIAYSAGVEVTSPGPFGLCCSAIASSTHNGWCSLAQLTSTVPSPIASNAPSIPTVPM